MAVVWVEGVGCGMDQGPGGGARLDRVTERVPSSGSVVDGQATICTYMSQSDGR